MALVENIHVPEEFFERGEISLEDIRTVVPEGQSLPATAVLKVFLMICQDTIRKCASWKKLELRGNDNRWGSEGCLSLNEMVQSGLLANLEDLLLADFSDFGDKGIATLAESLKSGQLSSLRHLKLHYVGFLEKSPQMRDNEACEGKAFGMEGAEALGSWLESDNARTVESLSIEGGQWSYQALASLLKSFRRGAAQNLAELEFTCHGFDDNSDASIEYQTPELAVVMELSESLKTGQVHTLRRLKLQSSAGYGIPALASLAQCSQLGRLKYLEISGKQGRAGVRGHEAAMASAFQANKLQILEVLKVNNEIQDDAAEILFSSMEAGNFSSLQTLALSEPWMTGRKARAMAKWLRSGHASNLVELRIFDFRSRDTPLVMASEDTDPMALDLIIDACFSGKSEKLEYIHVPSSQFEEEKVLQWVRALEGGGLPLLTEFPCAERFLSSRPVPRAILNAYKGNKFLTTTFWEGTSTTSDYGTIVQSLEAHRRRNQFHKEALKALETEPLVSGTHGKVFLCGNPGVGKTTLRQTLQATWWTQLRSKPASATRGIAVDHMRLAGKRTNTEELELAFWDLAGQNEFEVLHNSFLPDIALGDGQATFFVIVCSANQSRESSLGTAQDALLYWLRFISSNSCKRFNVNKDLRRRVLVVLNCFWGQQSGHDPETWKEILGSLQRDFEDSLNLHSEPFILNAKKKTQLRQFKEQLHLQAGAVLRQTPIPKICTTLLRSCLDWVAEEENRKYPVLSWNQYCASVVRAGWSHETVKAATVYLHETGHIILFKMLQRSAESSSESDMTDQATSESDITDQATLVLDPGWLCERVIGGLLLPEHLLRDGEESLSKYRNKDESLSLALVQRSRFQISEENCEQMVRILVRLGLGYPVSSNCDNIFIPALIRDNPMPTWFTTSASGASHGWMMGFSLSSKDSWTTFLPVGVLRKLQVKLAEDDKIGRRGDSGFRAARSSIWFKWEGLGFLVEYSGDPMNSQQNRLDILVKPLVENDDDTDESVRMVRRKQVRFAQIIVDRALEVASDCPGLELKRSVVHPWMIGHDFVSLRDRDVRFSVEDMMDELRKEIENRITHGQDNELWTTNWTVGRQLVRYEDVLGEGDWRDVADIFEKRCELTELALEQLHVLNPPRLLQDEEEYPVPGESHHSASTQEEAASTDNFILRRLWSEVREGRREMQQWFRETRQGLRSIHLRLGDIDDGIRRVTTRLHKVLQLQHELNRHVQYLEMFTVAEKLTSVPRFMYLTTEKGGGAWKRLKDIVSREVFLHFWCEAAFGDSKMHEVEGQLGVDVRRLKGWAEKLAPILDWSLKIAFVAAKIAGTAVLPGFGLLTPLLSSDVVQNGSLMTSGLGDLLQFSSDGLSQNVRGCNVDDSREKELRGAARAEVKILLDDLSVKEFKQMVGLRRVTILDNGRLTGEVVWICNSCFERYGSRVKEIS